MLPEFDLVTPCSLPEALESLAGGADGAVPLAGGTNLLVELRARRTAPRRVVSLARLEELRAMGREDGLVRLGGGTRVAELMRSPLVAEEAPALAAAARVFGGAMVRNAATLAGNLCYGSPAADLVPPLMALDTEVLLQSAGGSRTMALADFCRGVRDTACRPDELLTELRWPARPRRSAHLFSKLGLRKGDAIAVTAVSVLISAAEGRCEEARIALGAVAPTVVRVPRAEAVLRGRVPTQAAIDEAAREAMEASAPIDDIRASADYRRHLVGVLTRRLVTQAWQAIG